MVSGRLETDAFLNKLQDLLKQTQQKGTVTITFKPYAPHEASAAKEAKSSSSSSKSKQPNTDNKSSSSQPTKITQSDLQLIPAETEPVLLCHARVNDQSQYSTIVLPKNIIKFQRSLHGVLALQASQPAGLLQSKNELGKRPVMEGKRLHRETQKKQRLEAKQRK